MNMQTVMKILGMLVLWSLVVGMIVLVDPILVRDIGWERSYLPMVGLFGLAIVYTVGWLSKSLIKGLIIAGLGVVTWYLAINQLLYWFVGMGILVVVLVVLTFTKES